MSEVADSFQVLAVEHSLVAIEQSSRPGQTVRINGVNTECKEFRLLMKEENSRERRADLWIDVTKACQPPRVFAKHRRQNFRLVGASPDYDPPASSGHVRRMLDDLAFLTLAGHVVTRPAEAVIDGS